MTDLDKLNQFLDRMRALRADLSQKTLGATEIDARAHRYLTRITGHTNPVSQIKELDQLIRVARDMVRMLTIGEEADLY